jgi:putative ABC transport system substrate-binding protein
MTARVVPVIAAADIDPAFVSMRQERSNGLFVGLSTFADVHMRRIAELAIQHGLPTIYDYGEPVRSGGLMSNGPNLPSVYRQIAADVGKILGGAKPSDLPFQQPTRLELVVNLKPARALGLKLPQSLWLLADEVVD